MASLKTKHCKCARMLIHYSLPELFHDYFSKVIMTINSYYVTMMFANDPNDQSPLYSHERVKFINMKMKVARKRTQLKPHQNNNHAHVHYMYMYTPKEIHACTNTIICTHKNMYTLYMRDALGHIE